MRQAARSLEYCHQANSSGDPRGEEHKKYPIFLTHCATYVRAVEEVARLKPPQCERWM